MILLPAVDSESETYRLHAYVHYVGHSVNLHSLRGGQDLVALPEEMWQTTRRDSLAVMGSIRHTINPILLPPPWNFSKDDLIE